MTLTLLLSYVLSVIMTSAVFSIFGYPLFSLASPIILLANGVMFVICHFVNHHRRIGGIGITLFLIGAMRFLRLFANLGYDQCNVLYWEWMLTGGDEVDFNLYYLTTLLLSVSIFFCIIIYYFANVQYRISLLTLCSLLPCVLYMKVMAEIDNYYVIFLTLGNLLVHYSHGIEQKSGNSWIGKKSYYKSALLFSAGILLLVALIPKEKDAKYYSKFEDLFLQGDTTSELQGDYEDLNPHSGNAEGFAIESNRRLYTAYGNGYTYLKRQNFDYYDFENRYWNYEPALSNTNIEKIDWENKQTSLSVTALQYSVKQGILWDSNFKNNYGLEKVMDATGFMESMNSWTLQAQNFSAGYYLSSSRATTLSEMGNEYTISANGNFYRTNGSHDADARYVLGFYPNMGVAEEWQNTGLPFMSYEKSLAFLQDLQTLYRQNDQDNISVDSFLEQQKEAEAYRSMVADNTDEIPADIVSLGKEITADCESELEIAKALEQYFRKGNFVYDIYYRPKDTSIQYFLTESHRGTCSDFATAYVLLARSVGLIARYAEGFLPEPSGNRNYYLIKESSAHAFPEVFIPNTGWIVFEPTVSNRAAVPTDIWYRLRKFQMDFGLVGAIGVCIFLVVFGTLVFQVLYPFLFEIVFRMSLYFGNEERVMIKSYQRMQGIITKRRNLQTGSMTPEEICAYLYEEGIDCKAYFAVLEQFLYGNKMQSLKDGRNIALKAYGLVYSMLKKKNK